MEGVGLEAEQMDDKLPRGLVLIEDYITPDEEAALVQAVDELPWLGEIQRRTQQYGYHFSFHKRGVDDAPVPPFPACFRSLVDERFLPDPRVPLAPNQLLINEYAPGEGLNPHIDSPADFEDCVVSLSLLDDWDMTFVHPQHGTVVMALPRRSLLVLTGDARYVWKHGIPPQAEGRSRRISLTFRKYKQQQAQSS